MDFSEVKSVFGFRVRLGNPELGFENLNPDFPIERTLSLMMSLVNSSHWGALASTMATVAKTSLLN